MTRYGTPHQTRGDRAQLHALLSTPRSVFDLLEGARKRDPDRVYAVDVNGTTTIGDLFQSVCATSDHLRAAGVKPGSRVAVGLGTSIEHVAVVFAVLKLGAVWVPLNTRLRGTALQHQLRDAGVTHLVTAPDKELAGELTSLAQADPGMASAGRDLPTRQHREPVSVWQLTRHSATGELCKETVSLMYTSGTTGPAKGVQVTNSMLVASAVGCVEAAEPCAGDVFYVWEPLFHIGGAQLMVLPVIMPISLALSERLSVSRFWQEAAQFGATHIHHLGGVLQMLLKQPPVPADRRHGVRISWGAGATAEIWKAAQQRFGLTVHECYGMTETSSIVTVNGSGPEDGIGRPLPWFETAVDAAEPGGAGELLVRPTQPGLITPGYLNRPDATAKARAGGWWRTGDLVREGNQGNLNFVGRANDSIRVRGENVSSWQVESIFNAHPNVKACAAVGVRAEVGEQEIMLFVVPVDHGSVDPVELVSWARDHMPDFQLPRYVRFLPELPLTPSRRVAKKQLPINLEDAVDLLADRH